jgi:hypothetical protein
MGALVLRGAVRDLLGREDQVVRAGLHGEGQALRLGLRDQGQRVGGRQVHHVHAAAGLAAEADGEPDRFHFHLGRARGQEAVVLARIGLGIFGRTERLELGVQQQGHVQARQLLHGASEDVFGRGREVVDAGVAHEGLEAQDPGLDHRRQLGGVARHHAAPEAAVHPAAAAGGGELGLEGGQAGGDGDAVERHVHQGGDAAGRGGARAGLEALPGGAAGVVQVHVGVDHARHDQGVRRHDLEIGRPVALPDHGGDPAVAHHHVRGGRAVRQQHVGGADHEITRGHVLVSWAPILAYPQFLAHLGPILTKS